MTCRSLRGSTDPSLSFTRSGCVGFGRCRGSNARVLLEWDGRLCVRNLDIEDLLGTIMNDSDPAGPTNVEASIRTLADGAAEYADYLETVELDTGMYRALHHPFSAGIDAGAVTTIERALPTSVQPIPKCDWTTVRY